MRDSAGVHIVEYGFPLAQPDMVCSLASEPDLSLGTVEGSGPQVFGRIDGVAQASTGAIVVADGLAMELRAFDPSGAHVWTTGGEGDGPGELRSITALATLAADSVAVFDARARRVSIFDGLGAFARGYSVARPEGTRSPALAALTRGAALVALGSHAALVPREGGAFRRLADLLFYDETGSLSARGPSVLEAELVTPAQPRGPVVPVGYLPLGRRTQLAAGSEGLVVATQERFELRRYLPTGAVEQVLRVDRPASLTDLDRYEASGAASPHGFFSDSLPALGRIRLDERDRVWVEEYVPAYEEQTATWWVFEPEGALEATATIPARFNPQVISVSAMIGIVEDDLGVAYVERRRLTCE